MRTILVLVFESGLTKYVPKTKKALDYLICNFKYIDDVYEVDIAEEYAESSKDCTTDEIQNHKQIKKN